MTTRRKPRCAGQTGGNMTFRTLAAAIALSLVAACPSAAQQTPPAYGPPITLEMAKKVMAGAEAEAVKSNWNVFIVIVDSGGNIVMLHRFDNTQLGSLHARQGQGADRARLQIADQGARGRDFRRRRRPAPDHAQQHHPARRRPADRRRRQDHRRHRRLRRVCPRRTRRSRAPASRRSAAEFEPLRRIQSRP